MSDPICRDPWSAPDRWTPAPAHQHVLETAAIWARTGRRVVIATVIRTTGSTPRPAGSQMAITDRGDVIGAVAGGCIEAAVIHEAEKLLADGEPRRLTFGPTPGERAWELGLPCGGGIEVYLETLD